jgi:serine protease Do
MNRLLLLILFSIGFCYAEGKGFSEVVTKLSPTVVNISTEHKVKLQNKGRNSPNMFEEFRDFFEKFEPFFDYNLPEKERDAISLGSGFIIDKSGIIVTNYHVIVNADEIKVTLSNCKNDCEQYVAKVLGYDQRTDLAVLKIDINEELPYLQFGNSSEAKVGDWVIAVGNPFGLGGSVSVGVISARGRDLNISQNSDFIQTDVALNAGNSGGPLCNSEGQVIGINTAIYSPSGGSVGIGFAVPSDIARPIIETLARGEKVERGWIGVTIQEITKDIRDSLGGDVTGVLVASVEKGSPAAKAGIKVGDVITAINGEKVNNTKKLVRAISGYLPDKEVNVSISRNVVKNRKDFILKVKVAKLQDTNVSNENATTLELIGLVLSNINNDLKRAYRIPDKIQGIIVLDIKSNKNSFLKKGDIIVSLGNNQLINNIQDFKNYIDDAKKQGQKSILVLINRANQSIFTALKID